MWIKKNCLYCDELFEAFETAKRIGWNKYCSKPCQRKGRPKIFSWDLATEEQKLDRMLKSFEKKAIRREGCWDWNGSLKGKNGYGTIKSGKDENMMAHRFSWQVNFGPIPEGLYVCHNCDNRRCTNPQHLFLGTHEDNLRDMISKNRNRGAVGERNIKAVLGNQKVLEIRNLLNSGISIKDIAEKFDVAFNTIFKIKTNKTWRHI